MLKWGIYKTNKTTNQITGVWVETYVHILSFILDDDQLLSKDMLYDYKSLYLYSVRKY